MTGSKANVTDEMVGAYKATFRDYFDGAVTGRISDDADVSREATRKGIEAALAAAPRAAGGVNSVREHLRQEMLKNQLKTTGDRDTYADGFGQGLAYAIGELDKAMDAAPRGWPDPLESDIATRLRNREIDDTDILDLFDKMEREIRVHRKTFCEDQSRTHEAPAKPLAYGRKILGYHYQHHAVGVLVRGKRLPKRARADLIETPLVAAERWQPLPSPPEPEEER